MHTTPGSVEATVVPLPPPTVVPRDHGRPPLLLPFVFLWRRRWRTLTVVALLLLLGIMAGVGGVRLWAAHHLEAARRAIALGHSLNAVDHLFACRRVRSDDPEVLLLCARVARRTGALTEASQLLDRCWQLRGDDDDVVLERILLRAARGEEDVVRPLLQARIDRNDPTAPLAREALILGALDQFRIEEGKREIDRWLEHDPDNTMALLLRGKLYELRQKSSDALLVYRRILELDPEHDEVRLRLTTILLELSQGEEALSHLEYLRRRLPGHPDVLVQLAQALDLQRRGEEARAVLDECIRLHPHNPAALAERGRLARRDGDSVQAEEDLRQAIALDPGNFTARYQYYLALGQNGKAAEAAKEEEAIRQLEADLHRINDLVNGRMQATPNDPAVYHEVAMISLRAGRPKEALRWLQNALQIDPAYEPTHRALASYYYESGNPVLSARHRAIAQQLHNPKQP
jgi:tetratricopeptide (TPR) repeat protein